MNAIAHYEEQTVTTQNRGRLIVLLYEGAIRFLRQALAAMEARDISKRNHYIARTRDILYELNTVLDTEAGGTLAQNLRALYNFLNLHLNRSNIQNNPQGLRQSIAILNELLSGWKAIVTE